MLVNKRWKRNNDDQNSWTGVFAKTVWILSQDNEFLNFEAHRDNGEGFNLARCQDQLSDYFQLGVPLRPLYEYWSGRDQYFRKTADRFFGIRQLRQDPVENVFSFICSTNNIIPRTSKMVENLCNEYGDVIAEVNSVEYRDFPSPEKLAGPGVTGRLRELGFGYHDKYVVNSAQKIQENGLRWLYNLRETAYDLARASLLTLPGVGPKVADCVCLMSLDKTCAIPVDTHVVQLAREHYNFGEDKKKKKTLTDKEYREISQMFRKLWGDYAGWAQTVLFCAELKMHREPSPKKRQKRGTSGQCGSASAHG